VQFSQGPAPTVQFIASVPRPRLVRSNRMLLVAPRSVHASRSHCTRRQYMHQHSSHFIGKLTNGRRLTRVDLPCRGRRVWQWGWRTMLGPPRFPLAQVVCRETPSRRRPLQSALTSKTTTADHHVLRVRGRPCGCQPAWCSGQDALLLGLARWCRQRALA
jgi:hypothetical protein